MTETGLKKINYLTEEQYQTAKLDGLINEDEIYITPDGDIVETNQTLWVNLNPNVQNFLPQTITLSSANYDYFDILYYSYYDKKTIQSMRVYKNHSPINLFTTFDYNGVMYGGNRIMTRISDTQYSLSTVYCSSFTQGTTNNTNDWIIPIAIYGGKRQKEIVSDPSLRTVQNLAIAGKPVSTETSPYTALTYTIPESGLYLITGSVNLNHYGQGGRELNYYLKRNDETFYTDINVHNGEYLVTSSLSYIQEFNKGDIFSITITNSAAVNWMVSPSTIQLLKM